MCAQPLRPAADRYDAYERAAFAQEATQNPARSRHDTYPPLGAIARVRHRLTRAAERILTLTLTLTPTLTPTLTLTLTLTLTHRKSLTNNFIARYVNFSS